MAVDDKRLIEQGFPCHQVGAETQRERGASSALPPLYYLHVWWARRPLTPSRAAVLGSLLPADTDPEEFVRSLGIEKKQAIINGVHWTITDKLLDRIEVDSTGKAILPVDDVVLRAVKRESERRTSNQSLILKLTLKTDRLIENDVVKRLREENIDIPEPWPALGDHLTIETVMADPAWAKERIQWETSNKIRTPDDKYGYTRAYTNTPSAKMSGLTVLDPTSGGGSIPFEALRLGHNVIANELNPVASTILFSTLQYPALYGLSLLDDIEKWGNVLRDGMVDGLSTLFPESPLSEKEQLHLKRYLARCENLIDIYSHEYLNGFLYCRQITCPHCNGEAPLFNTCWLSKEAKDPWGVRIVTHGEKENATVSFETYRVVKGRGPNGESPDAATVTRGVGTCVHCRQAITSQEIKAQARGESPHGTWRDRLYAVVANRFVPKLDKNGQPQRFKSGDKKGEIKTRKIRFFRAPNQTDLEALEAAEQQLNARWNDWEEKGLIPTEKFPRGNDNRPLMYGMTRWCDMFTPRQLLGHVTLVEGLNALKPQILKSLGTQRGKAVITYLQFAIDKGVDYNSRQTRWEYTRGIVKGNFGRHDFSLKWTFGEMIFTGPNSGAAWGLSQVLDAYKGIAELVAPLHEKTKTGTPLPLKIINGTAAHIPQVADGSVDLVCMDPPYYNNVQYAELSDFYYVWQKRTLKDLYPDLFNRRLTSKQEEAVANPDRDGSAAGAKQAYETIMKEIFAEARRCLKDDGLLSLMFTHKSQDAWETLTRSLIEAGWIITATVPVESEAAASMHQKDMAAAASSIFISCRKRKTENQEQAVWKGLGGQGVQAGIQRAVTQGLQDFAQLKLNPVDQMVSCYGLALRVLSENWPVLDGDDPVTPIRAMNEASRVVAESQIETITRGELSVMELDAETAMTLTLFGIWGLNEFSFDEALNISKSLNISMENKQGGYRVKDKCIGVNLMAAGKRSRGAGSEETPGFHAPLVRRGSKLRIAGPEERQANRVASPQTDWDIMQGLILAYEQGDVIVARQYLEQHAETKKKRILDLLAVWSREMADEKRRQQAELILYGLNAS